MRTQKIFLSVGIGVYLFLTACAFVFTITRIEIVPAFATRFFYGMMAPFQGYYVRNSELVAWGRLSDGAWQEIDLRRYFPGKTGERTYRQFNLTRYDQTIETMEEKRRPLAEQLLALENARGVPYVSVRLIWREWPKSPEGFYALNTDPYRSDTFLIEVP